MDNGSSQEEGLRKEDIEPCNEPPSTSDVNLPKCKTLEHCDDSVVNDKEFEGTADVQNEDENGDKSNNDSKLREDMPSIENESSERLTEKLDDSCEDIYTGFLEESMEENLESSEQGDVEKNEVGKDLILDSATDGEDRLLTDISELVDEKINQNVIATDENSDKVDSQNYVITEVKSLNNGEEICNFIEEDEKVEDISETSQRDLLLESEDVLTSVDNSDVECSDTNLKLNSVENKESDKNTPNTTETEKANIKSKKLFSSESAFQRLASLGVTAEVMPAVDSKESALMKLANRGAISITPAGGGSLTSINSSVSITTSKSKYKPGPKSAMMRQRAKKIKIDPEKSLDIDKDFNSLISFLKTGTEETTVKSNPTQENNVPVLDSLVPENVLNIKPMDELDPTLNDTPVKKITNDDLLSAMDVDISDDKSTHETDSESHDESKSFSHRSDYAEENEEKVPSSTAKFKNVIEEGSAEILLSTSKNVFYNKVQEFNRDMSIAALTVFSEMHQQDPRTRNRGKKRKIPDGNDSDTLEIDGSDDNVFEPGKKSENGITILEALSATGLRSIRYSREIPGVREVIANDLSEDAVETIKQNIDHNRVGNIVTTSMSDASLLMYQHQASQEWYDAVDLDPYGCPSRFLDSAVQAVRDGGLLLITCTDMAVLAGNSPETCYVKYGAVSLRSPACHEMALRIALQCIESHANRYGRYIVPLLSFSADFYIRLILQIYTSPVTCKKTTSKLSMVFQCVGCNSHCLQPLGVTSTQGGSTQPKFSLAHGPLVNTTCFHCHHKHYMGGPIWSAPLHSNKFVESMLAVVEKGRFATSKRMQGMLEVIREELPDAPLYYTIAGLCSKLHCQAIPLIDIRSAILNSGYRVSASHAAPTAIKTNAPTKVIWDIMRCWVHMNPVSQKRLLTGSVPAAIILEPPNLIANFDIHPKARPSSSMRKLLRYQPNPAKNWGPGTRARCNTVDDMKDEKRKANQNKNKNKVVKKNIDIIEVVTIDDEDETVKETDSAASTSAVAP